MMPFPKMPTMRLVTCAFLSGGLIGAAISFTQLKEAIAKTPVQETGNDMTADTGSSSDSSLETPAAAEPAK